MTSFTPINSKVSLIEITNLKEVKMFDHNEKEHKFVKIVYTKVKENGKEELVPLRLYTDGSLEPNQ